MSDYAKLQNEVRIARNELKNLRQNCFKEKANLKQQINEIRNLLIDNHAKEETTIIKDHSNTYFDMDSIGFISSCFKSKNGIPRQSALCPSAKAILTIDKNLFTNPEHSLVGLSKFSHIWILFVFHENGNDEFTKAKVHPPRLNGTSVGVFSTRSPHRPNPIGLSLVKLDKIKGNTLHLSGVDLLDNTPVLDIKPYIQVYDMPDSGNQQTCISEESVSTREDANNQSQLSNKPNLAEKILNSTSELIETSRLQNISNYFEVNFTSRAIENLKNFHHQSTHEEHCDYCLEFVNDFDEARNLITEVLQNDPRSTYRKTKCQDKLYYFFVDNMHVTSWFDGHIAEVVKVQPKIKALKC